MSNVRDKPHLFKLEAVPGTTVEALAGEIARYEGDGGTPRTAWPVRADGLIPMHAVRGGRTMVLVGVVARREYDAEPSDTDLDRARDEAFRQAEEMKYDLRGAACR